MIIQRNIYVKLVYFLLSDRYTSEDIYILLHYYHLSRIIFDRHDITDSNSFTVQFISGNFLYMLINVGPYDSTLSTIVDYWLKSSIYRIELYSTK